MLKTESRNLCNICLIGWGQRDRAQTMSKCNWQGTWEGLERPPPGLDRRVAENTSSLENVLVLPGLSPGHRKGATTKEANWGGAVTVGGTEIKVGDGRSSEHKERRMWKVQSSQ